MHSELLAPAATGLAVSQAQLKTLVPQACKSKNRNKHHYQPGGREDSKSEKIDMSKYIRRGTVNNMASHEIVNCGEALNLNDVVILRRLTVYYRKGS